jgi:hypothetical protein
VRDLRAQLEHQEARRSATKAKLVQEKSRRRAAEGQRDEYWKRCTQQQETSQTNTVHAEAVKEGEGPNWKAMHLEQERQTEHYKLKYIAAKEEKATMEAKSTEQERKTEHYKLKYITVEEERRTLEARSVKQEIMISECKHKLLNQEEEAAKLKVQLVEGKKASKDVKIEYHELAKCLDIKADVVSLTQQLEASQSDQRATIQELRDTQWRRSSLELQIREWEERERTRGDSAANILVETLEQRVQYLEGSANMLRAAPSEPRLLAQKNEIQRMETSVDMTKAELDRT